MNSRQVAAALLWLSALTHVSQIWVYPGEASVPGAAFFGLIYARVGFGVTGDTGSGPGLFFPPSAAL